MGADELAQQFQAQRGRLRALAYRMLGSLSEADDAVQEAWLRLGRADAAAIENFVGWLTTVVARLCLDSLRARQARSEEPLDAHLPDPVLTRSPELDPEHELLLADSLGMALMVVLETLPPAERVAFVLHDMFAVPFEQIAALTGRSLVAARQLASRARRRVQAAAPTPAADRRRQREVVAAYVAASRAGDLEALVALLDPDAVLRADGGSGKFDRVRGARAIAERALRFARGASGLAIAVRPVLVNGTAAVAAWRPDGEPLSLLAFTLRDAKIAELFIFTDSPRLRRLGLTPPAA